MNGRSIINREYSWLNFNSRVLFEASRPDNPVLEKIKFLSISDSNLEEFFMIRVAVLKNQIKAKISESSVFPGITPAEQISHINLKVKEMLKIQHDILYGKIVPGLRENGIKLLLDRDELLPLKKELEPFFDNELKVALTPLSIGPTLPFITLVTGRLYLAIGLNPGNTKEVLEKSTLSFLEIPSNVFGRFYNALDGKSFIPLENIIRLFLNKLYTGYEITTCNVVKITRDADISIQGEDAPNLLKEIESKIKRMHRRSAVRLEYESGLPDAIIQVICEKNRLEKKDVYQVDGILNLKDLLHLYNTVDRDNLKFKAITPVYPRDFKNRNIFKAAGDRDIILYHPFHSYDPVVELISAAADDPNVIAIKQTLYRTSSDSEIIRALIRAAENGKYVTVIDELKARFDEKRNIEWARKLEDAGAHVTYGVSGLKTHAKALLIIRKEKSGIRRYIHLATGNYNENTARLYSDFSLFSTDEKLTSDISSLFNLLTGFSLEENWKAVTIAPTDLRQRFIRLIERETANAKIGRKAMITAKMNSLSDPAIINRLYDASETGVVIRLIVRGICSIIPGPGNNGGSISVISIIGRYLEHSRIYYFYNAGDEELYLSSADWMERNLDRRIELLFPVNDNIHREFLKKIIDFQFGDTENLWELMPDGEYGRRETETGKRDSFENIYNYVREIEISKERNSRVLFRPIVKNKYNSLDREEE